MKGFRVQYPVESIGKIHKRNKERLDKFSRVVQLEPPSGGKQMTTVYSFKGQIHQLVKGFDFIA